MLRAKHLFVGAPVSVRTPQRIQRCRDAIAREECVIVQCAAWPFFRRIFPHVLFHIMMDFADTLFIGSYVSDKKQRPEERAEEPAFEDRQFPIRVFSR